MFVTVTTKAKPLAREVEKLESVDITSITTFVNQGSVVILTDTLATFADFLHIDVADITVVEDTEKAMIITDENRYDVAHYLAKYIEVEKERTDPPWTEEQIREWIKEGLLAYYIQKIVR